MIIIHNSPFLIIFLLLRFIHFHIGMASAVFKIPPVVSVLLSFVAHKSSQVSWIFLTGAFRKARPIYITIEHTFCFKFFISSTIVKFSLLSWILVWFAFAGRLPKQPLCASTEEMLSSATWYILPIFLWLFLVAQARRGAYSCPMAPKGCLLKEGGGRDDYFAFIGFVAPPPKSPLNLATHSPQRFVCPRMGGHSGEGPGYRGADQGHTSPCCKHLCSVCIQSFIHVPSFAIFCLFFCANKNIWLKLYMPKSPN